MGKNGCFAQNNDVIRTKLFIQNEQIPFFGAKNRRDSSSRCPPHYSWNLTLLISLETFHYADIHAITLFAKLVIDDILHDMGVTCMIWSSATPLPSKCLRKILKRRKDLPQRRMPVIIFIIPLPSAEISLFRYSLRSKYIVCSHFLCHDTFFESKSTFFT